MKLLENMTLDELMPIREAEKATGHSNMTIMRLVHDGRLRHVRFSGRIFLVRWEVDRLIETRKSAIPSDGHVYYTVAEAAKMAGCTRANVYDGIVRGTVSALRVNLGTREQYVIQDEEVQKWIEGRKGNGLGNGSEQAAAGA